MRLLMVHGEAGRRFSVVIVNYNGGEMVLDAVRSALGEGVAAREIVIVDNGTVDGSDEVLERTFPELRFVRNGCNAGFARAVNQGLRIASGEFVLLLNNDAELRRGALDAFAHAFDTMPRVAIAGGQLRYPDGRLQHAFGPLPTVAEEALPRVLLKRINPERYRRTTEATGIRLVEGAFGACLAVRSAAVAEIGMLDEDFFFYFEETEWCRRAGLHGWQVAFVPEAQAVHVLGHTAERSFSAARVEFQRSKLTYFRKCMSRPLYLAGSVVMVVRTAINAVVHSVWAALTLFRNQRERTKMHAYWTVLAWHLLGRPGSWGLPGKCPARAA